MAGLWSYDARGWAPRAIWIYGLDKLLTRSLRGMFDGPSTVPLHWDGPGLVLDLSAVPLESDALPLVMVVAHRVTDLVAQANDGSATSKIAAGLLADSATKIVHRQAPDQIASAVEHVGLTDPESRILAQLSRGRAFWKIGAHTTVVEHVIAPSEAALVDTDQRMLGLQLSTGRFR